MHRSTTKTTREDVCLESFRTSFTEPKNHSDKNFIYLVVSLSEDHDFKIQIKKLTGTFEPSQNINLSLFPEKIHELKLISASVVSNKRPLVFQNTGGLIIRCPIENILNVGLRDLHLEIAPKTLYHSAEKIMNIDLTVNDLLQDKSGTTNEVVIRGESTFGKVEVIGFFDVPNTSSRFNTLAKKMELPIIHYPWQEGVVLFEPDEVERKEQAKITERLKSLKELPTQEHSHLKQKKQEPSTFAGFNPGFLNTPQKNVETMPHLAPKAPPAETFGGLKMGFLNTSSSAKKKAASIQENTNIKTSQTSSQTFGGLRVGFLNTPTPPKMPATPEEASFKIK